MLLLLFLTYSCTVFLLFWGSKYEFTSLSWFFVDLLKPGKSHLFASDQIWHWNSPFCGIWVIIFRNSCLCCSSVTCMTGCGFQPSRVCSFMNPWHTSMTQFPLNLQLKTGRRCSYPDPDTCIALWIDTCQTVSLPRLNVQGIQYSVLHLPAAIPFKLGLYEYQTVLPEGWGGGGGEQKVKPCPFGSVFNLPPMK